METDEELKMDVSEFLQEEVSKKLMRCKECNRQKFNHPGGSLNFGQGKCKGLQKLEFDTAELKADDERVAKEREVKRRGVKRDAPEDAKENEDNKRPKPDDEMVVNLGSQETMMKMMMQMMQRSEERRREDREERLRERELELKSRELEMRRQEELLRSMNAPRFSFE